MIHHYSTGEKTIRNHNSKVEEKGCFFFFGWGLKERRNEAQRTKTMKVTDDYFAIPCKDSKKKKTREEKDRKHWLLSVHLGSKNWKLP